MKLKSRLLCESDWCEDKSRLLCESGRREDKRRLFCKSGREAWFDKDFDYQ